MGDAQSPLGEASSRLSNTPGPSAESKREPNSKPKAHESLIQSDAVKNDGDLGKRANSRSLHSSTALDQARYVGGKGA